MSEDKKKEILNQEVSEEELQATNGGYDCGFVTSMPIDNDTNDCKKNLYRWFYEQEWPYGRRHDCAKSVEDGSWCNQADACTIQAVLYRGMKECSKAHM